MFLWRGCLLRVGVIGINFKTADLELREAVARGAESLSEEKRLFFKHPTVLLSTCNRTEIYFSAEDLAEAHSDLLSLLRSQIEAPFEQRLYSYFGIDAFTHLCRVASGLDSAILAETEIQRQVKVAYTKAAAVIRLSPSLHYAFQKSLKVAKEVRSTQFLDRGAPTLFGTMWRLITDVLGDLRKCKVLLIGYSEINRGFASFLSHKGSFDVSLCTRSPERIAGAKGREILSRWQEYDLIVSAAKAEGYLIEGEGREKQLIFDLSVPRTVDPTIQKAALFNIEQIDQLIEKRRKGNICQLEKCEALVEERVQCLARLYREKLERASSVVV
jgi:glutamyl-tRNA reductase